MCNRKVTNCKASFIDFDAVLRYTYLARMAAAGHISLGQERLYDPGGAFGITKGDKINDFS